MTAKPGSMLGRAADIVLALPDAAEACDVTQAPTTSTTLQMALGDALAVALLKRRGFTASDFGNFHPGGSLGAALKKVEDLMHTGAEIPLVGEDAPMPDAIKAMSDKSFGCVGVVAKNGRLAGIITDGDLRRKLGDATLLSKRAADVMTKQPRTTTADTLAGDAIRRMTDEKPKVTMLFVVEDGRPTGILHMHDLLRAGLG
jgi:arabinose-5-phosphate isomerase